MYKMEVGFNVYGFRENGDEIFNHSSKEMSYEDTFEDIYKKALEKVEYYVGDDKEDDYKVTHFETFKDDCSGDYVSIWNLKKEGLLPNSNNKEVVYLNISVEKVVTGQVYHI